MKTSIPTPDSHQELREALRALCGAYGSSCWQRIDVARGDPEEFVTALTGAGRLAALIPHDDGGSGLGLGRSDAEIAALRASGAT